MFLHKLVRFTLASLLVACAGPLSAGWMTINIAGYMSRPRLLEARLTPSEPNVHVFDQIGKAITYSPPNGPAAVPETFTFRWRAEGDPGESEVVFAIRSKLPPHVLERLASTRRPPHMLSLDFRVLHGQPECVWSFTRLDSREGEEHGVIRP
ncbi:MAG TPA: hypothetical protein VF169_04505 [Albitalea sp.]|uniref:hypothetical protein n=1 Tax=Piscinibacter sp. TaxID=1903157 RepID=UPI002ED54BD6